jgi:hypothetical protein
VANSSFSSESDACNCSFSDTPLVETSSIDRCFLARESVRDNVCLSLPLEEWDYPICVHDIEEIN